jgi:hypothetical protein
VYKGGNQDVLVFLKESGEGNYWEPFWSSALSFPSSYTLPLFFVSLAHCALSATPVTSHTATPAFPAFSHVLSQLHVLLPFRLSPILHALVSIDHIGHVRGRWGL